MIKEMKSKEEMVEEIKSIINTKIDFSKMYRIQVEALLFMAKLSSKTGTISAELLERR